MEKVIAKKRSIRPAYKKLGLAIFFFLFSFQLHSQHRFYYDKNHLATLTFGPQQENGFRISVSLVALFTAGATDRNGFRLGGGITLSQTIDNWTLSAGLDAYKAKQKFGIGTSFAGLTFDSGKYGATYYVNKYHQGNKQISGIVNIHLDQFRINFEDDVLAYPFVGFKIYDRFRTAALELRYKGFLLGTNVYTTDITGVTDASSNNDKGVFATGKQISSPVYVGYSTNDLILRCGINNSKIGGLLGQNAWHRLFFQTPDFNPGDYNNMFIQTGVDKPYTLY